MDYSFLNGTTLKRVKSIVKVVLFYLRKLYLFKKKKKIKNKITVNCKNMNTFESIIIQWCNRDVKIIFE